MGRDNESVSIGTWVVVIILLAIPIVGIITAIVLAFSSNENLKNFAWAVLSLIGIGIVLSLLFAGCGMI